jgi:cysteine desulfurase
MIYLNNAAGTRLYPEVIETITDVLENYWGNPHDPTSFGHDAQMIIHDVTQQVADDINCSPDEIIWTSGACEANSLAIMGVLNNNPGMDFFTTELEHASINEIVKNVPSSNSVGSIPNDIQGFVYELGLKNILAWNYSRNIKTLVSISLANSEIGVVQTIESIAEIVHKYGGILHVDATQAYPWYKVDVETLGIDLMSVSGQKLHAPKGIGFLYVKDGIALQPLIYGSQQASRRGGTMPTHLIAGFGKALELIRERNPADRVKKLGECMLHHLGNIDRISLNGPLSEFYRLPNIISLTIEDVNAETLVTMCDLMGVVIGKGSACKFYEPTPSQTLLAIGLTEEQALNTIRISLDEFNTVEEIIRAADIITQLVEQIRSNA